MQDRTLGLGFAELLVILALIAFFWLVWGRIFRRAGYSQWWVLTLLVPLFNWYMMAKLVLKAGFKWWGVILLFIPVVNFPFILYVSFGTWPSEK